MSHLKTLFFLTLFSFLSGGHGMALSSFEDVQTKEDKAKLTLHQSCNSQAPSFLDRECDVYEDCNLGKCVCKSDVTVYDKGHDRCLIRTNQKCGPSSKSVHVCVEHAICKPFSNDMSSFTCQCSSGFETKDNGLCVHPWNDTCMTNQDCDTGLKCGDNGRCSCKLPNQVFNPERKRCEGVFMKGCNDNEWNSCVGDLACEQVSGKHVCVCPKGLSVTMSGENCGLGYGAKCDFDSKNETVSCDASRHLTCQNVGKDQLCRCENEFLEYSKIKKRCLGLEGAHCAAAEDCGEGTVCTPPAKKATVGYCKEIPWASTTTWVVTIGVLSLIVLSCGGCWFVLCKFTVCSDRRFFR